MNTFTHPDRNRAEPATHRPGLPSPAPKAAAPVLAIVLVLAGCGGGHSSISPTTTTPATTSATSSANKGGDNGLPGVGDPPTYWTTIQQQLATGLDTTVAALTQLWGTTTASGPKGQGAPATTTILDVATEHGLSVTQLRTVELGAIQQACDALEHAGSLTAQQASARMLTIRGWGQSDLDGYSMYAYQQH